MRLVLRNMKEQQETKILSITCEHCNRTFLRESTLLKHLCEQKRRWLDRDKQANRIAYVAWRNYYLRYHPGKKSVEYTDFTRSQYYGAFIKFAIYCSDIGAVNPAAYSDWLTKNLVPIDTWNTDSVYTKYLVEYLRAEDPYDAVRRSMENLLDYASIEHVMLSDIFKWGNPNKLCYMITAGKISPWVLYNSKGGVEFLSKIDSDQTNLLFEYIHPEKWSIKFMREQDMVNGVKKVLAPVPL